MKLQTRRALLRNFLWLCLLAQLTPTSSFGQVSSRAVRSPTALDRYVQAPDPTYEYKLIDTARAEGRTDYLLEMTSQTWRKPTEVDRPLWKHWLRVTVPDGVTHSTALLYITGGSNANRRPNPDAALIDMATTTKSVVAELRMVPNQPLTFADDKRPRVEDEMIAYTWDKYLRTGDDTWPARLPMTKSAVRAMDTVTAFCGSREGGGISVERFVVAGASKRGWTTWTTAAVDSRVVAVVPLVIDLLNIEKSFEHHYRVYGFWAPAIKDYEELGIMDWTGTKQYRALMNIVEPYSYRDRLTMPKLMINATGDQFFLPDSSQFYFDDLKGEKYLRYVPNADHSLKNSDARESMLAFYDAVLRGVRRPEFSWQFERDGGIRVKTVDRPTEVKLWQATNPERRDFRLEKIGPAFKSTTLADRNGVYEARIAKPAKGWTAFFVELTFPSGGKHPFKFTTGVRVLPDKLPFKAYRPNRKNLPRPPRAS